MDVSPSRNGHVEKKKSESSLNLETILCLLPLNKKLSVQNAVISMREKYNVKECV